MPKELALQKEHLAREEYSGKVNFILQKIREAREDLATLDLADARKAYLELMQHYLDLKAEEQKIVYTELTDLYYERKKAEAIP